MCVFSTPKRPGRPRRSDLAVLPASPTNDLDANPTTNPNATSTTTTTSTTMPPAASQQPLYRDIAASLASLSSAPSSIPATAFNHHNNHHHQHQQSTISSSISASDIPSIASSAHDPSTRTVPDFDNRFGSFPRYDFHETTTTATDDDDDDNDDNGDHSVGSDDSSSSSSSSDSFDFDDQRDDSYGDIGSVPSTSTTEPSSSSTPSPKSTPQSTTPQSQSQTQSQSHTHAHAQQPTSPSTPTIRDEYDELIPANVRASLRKFVKTRHTFEYMSLVRLFAPREFGDLDATTPLWLRMAFYALMAIIAHWAREAVHQATLERRLREIASQLFDQVTPGTATAFAFAARYYWGVKQELSEHYTRMVVGICQQLLQQYPASPRPSSSTTATTSSTTRVPGTASSDLSEIRPPQLPTAPIDINTPEFILQIQLFAVGLCGMRSSPWRMQLLELTMAQLEPLVDNDWLLLATPIKFSLLRLGLLMRIKISQVFNRIDVGDAMLNDVMFTPQESGQLLSILDMFESATEFNRYMRPVKTICLLCVRILVYLGNRQYDTCLALARVVLTLCEERKCRFEHSQPLLPEMIYWLVRVCLTLNQPVLARRALPILEQLVLLYPAHVNLYHDALKFVPPAPPQLAMRTEDLLDSIMMSASSSLPSPSTTAASMGLALPAAAFVVPSPTVLELDTGSQQYTATGATNASFQASGPPYPPSPISWEQVLQRPMLWTGGNYYLGNSSWPTSPVTSALSEDPTFGLLLDPTNTSSSSSSSSTTTSTTTTSSTAGTTNGASGTLPHANNASFL